MHGVLGGGQRRRSPAMARRILAALFFTVSYGAIAGAESIRFAPPTDPDGRVFSFDDNDGWDGGRGIVFTTLRPVLLSSVSLYHDLTALDLAYQVASVERTTGLLRDGQTVLRQGSRTVTTAGLEWVPFNFAPLRLSGGNSYHIEFSFSGNGNQNVFHNNCPDFPPDNPNSCDSGEIRYSVGPFSDVDGTQSGDTANFVQPAVMVEVSEETPAIPEPGTFFLLGGAAVAAGVKRLQMRLRLLRYPR